MAWNPEQYVLGSYFQNEINETFRKKFPEKPCGTILDVGCGDGQYSKRLAENLKRGHILGIDASAEMVEYANQHWAGATLSFETQGIETFHRVLEFDFILSFWCLHWTRLDEAFPNIFQALKQGGRVYAVFSSLSDHSILQTWRELAKGGRHCELAKQCVVANAAHQDYFYRVLNTVTKLPFQQLKLNLETVKVHFPSLDYFRHLLLSMPFMHSVMPEIRLELIDDLTQAFQTICQRKYGGTLYYETRPIFLEALK